MCGSRRELGSKAWVIAGQSSTSCSDVRGRCRSRPCAPPIATCDSGWPAWRACLRPIGARAPSGAQGENRSRALSRDGWCRLAPSWEVSVRVTMFEVDVGPERLEAVQHQHGSKSPDRSPGSKFRSSIHGSRPCRNCDGDACPTMFVTIRWASTIVFHMPAHSHQTLVIEDLEGTPTLVCADDWSPSARWPCAGLFVDFAGPLGRQHTHTHIYVRFVEFAPPVAMRPACVFSSFWQLGRQAWPRRRVHCGMLRCCPGALRLSLGLF